MTETNSALKSAPKPLKHEFRANRAQHSFIEVTYLLCFPRGLDIRFIKQKEREVSAVTRMVHVPLKA